MSYVFPPAPTPSVPVVGTEAQFPVHRIYCVGRNYEEHAKEMGFTGREPPFFFMKPADAIVVAPPGATTPLPYPSLTTNLHHEIELVVAIGKGFDHSAPIRPITPAAQAGDVGKAGIWLQVNGVDRQRSNVAQLIWNIAETIEHLSAAWELQPGDLIYTGTPEGVSAVVTGDVLEGGVDGLGSIRLKLV